MMNIEQTTTNRNQVLIPTLMWFFGAAAFFLQYACRIASSGMQDELMLTFGITAAHAGNLAALFYYPYVLMQLFVGRIVDRFPAHKVLIMTMLAFLIANQLFSEATSIWDAGASRLVKGTAGAFTFVATMKLAMLWFDRKYLGVLAGLTQVSGMLGVAFGGWFVDVWLVDDNWRFVIKYFSWMLLVVWLGMVFIMRSNTAEEECNNEVSILSGLKIVLSNPQSWYNALYAGLLYLPTAAFGEFWGIQYLSKTNVMITKHQATVAAGMIFIGWAIGGILSGALSDYLKKRKGIMFISPVLSLVTLLPVLYIHTMPAMGLYVCLFLYGLFNTGLVISYALSGEINPPNVSGVSIAFCNMFSILGGTLALPLIGEILDLYWDGTMVNMVPVYSTQAYLTAFNILPISLVIALIFAVGVKETHCQAKQ